MDGSGPSERREIVEYLTLGLTVALCSAQPSLYPRHRWTGADIAVDELSIMEGCHKLMSTTFLRFAASFVQGAVRVSLLQVGLRAAAYGVGKMDQLPMGHADEEVGEAQPSSSGAYDPVGNADVRAPSDPQEVDWSKVNAKNRSDGAQFCSADPLGK